MSSSIDAQYPTIPVCQTCNFLCHAGKTKTGVSCSVMTDHNSTVCIFRRCVVDPMFQARRFYRDLKCLIEVTGCRYWCKVCFCVAISCFGFGWPSCLGRPGSVNKNWHTRVWGGQACIAGGPIPPYSSPRLSSSSSSSRSSSSWLEDSWGSLAILALIADL